MGRKKSKSCAYRVSLLDDHKKKSKEDLVEEVVDKIIEIDKLKEEKEKLEKKLRKYENPHTPSSKKSFAKVEVQGVKVGRKKGKKSGHKGRTREKYEPTEAVDVTVDFNPKTGNKNIAETGYVEEIVITDFKIVKVVTQYNCYEYLDLDTGEIFMAKHTDMPERGIFGKNVLAFANYLRFKCRVPFEKISDAFTTVFDIPMTSPTALDICTRVSEKVSPQYAELKKEIREEKAVHADETGAKNNGLPGWLWGFFSLSVALFVFNQKRGGDIVEKTLGKDFKGILGCDGWSTYAAFSKEAGVLLQRCWAHAIREVKDVCMNRKRRNASLEKAYEWFCDIFDKVREARKIKSQEMREQLYMELKEELDNWLQVYSSYRTLRPLVNKIKNGKDFWFTCILYPEIEPTNNRAERGLRSWVVLRKIIGCLRSEQGEKTTQTMLSLFHTWELRGINPYTQLKDLL